MQFTLPPDAPTVADVNARAANSRRTGYWMVSLTTSDLDAFAAAVPCFGGQVIHPPITVVHPLLGNVRALIAAAPGGERFEVAESEV